MSVAKKTVKSQEKWRINEAWGRGGMASLFRVRIHIRTQTEKAGRMIEELS